MGGKTRPRGYTPPRKICEQCGKNFEIRRAPVPDHKICHHCGEKFIRRDGEAPYGYRKRKTCSTQCCNSLRANSNRVPTGSKICEGCGDSFDRRNGEDRSHFHKKKYCSKQCRTPRAPDTKICEGCGDSFSRRYGEQSNEYRKRRTCGVSCGNSISANTYNIHGAKLNVLQIAELAEVSENCIRSRMKRGRDPLTGKKK